MKQISVNPQREAAAYIVSGGITTGVNYLLYTGLLLVHISWLTANCIAWAGAVLAAYILNRRWVFRSEKHIGKELLSFASLRFVTLIVENILLWLLIGQIGISAFPAKIAVSIVTVIGNYVLCKYSIFKKEVICHGEN